MNYYVVLGVAENADTEAIKRAYRRLVKECHPDTHPGVKKGEERFKQVSEAYAVLSDENKRREYDRKNRSGKGVPKIQKQNPSQTVRRNPIDTTSIFEKYMGFK